MITTLKLAGLSAVLSAGLVGGFSAPEGKLESAAPAKLFYDRADGSAPAAVALASHDPRLQVAIEVNRDAKGHRSRIRQDVACTDAAWLMVAADCVPNFDPASTRATGVRSSGNVSVVRREAVATLASR